MQNRLTIVISTFNNNDNLYNCIRTLIKNTPYAYDIAISDNNEDRAIQDDINKMIEGFGCPYVTAYHFGENNLSKSLNYIAQKTQTEFICFTHDDLIYVPSPTFWQDLIGLLSHSDVGLVAPSASYVDDVQHILRTDCPRYTKTQYVHGMFHLTKTNLFNQMGGFDLQLEVSNDIDYCLRLADKQYDIVVDRSHYVHHIAGATHRKNFSDEKAFQSWIMDISDITHTIMAKKHGVKRYYEYLRESRDRESMEAVGTMALEPPKEWKPRLAMKGLEVSAA